MVKTKNLENYEDVAKAKEWIRTLDEW